jgi:uncharacterized membrane protein
VRTDTTYVFHNRDSVIIRYSTRRDTVRIEAECPPSKTEIRYRTISEKVTVEKKMKFKDRVLWIAIGAAAIGGIVLLLSILIKKFI